MLTALQAVAIVADCSSEHSHRLSRLHKLVENLVEQRFGQLVVPMLCTLQRYWPIVPVGRDILVAP